MSSASEEGRMKLDTGLIVRAPPTHPANAPPLSGPAACGEPTSMCGPTPDACDPDTKLDPPSRSIRGRGPLWGLPSFEGPRAAQPAVGPAPSGRLDPASGLLPIDSECFSMYRWATGGRGDGKPCS